MMVKHFTSHRATRAMMHAEFHFIVMGTGGVPLRLLATRQKNSEFFQADTFGVLRLELYSDRYAWEFLPVGGGLSLDAGTGSCVLPQ